MTAAVHPPAVCRRQVVEPAGLRGRRRRWL